MALSTCKQKETRCKLVTELLHRKIILSESILLNRSSSSERLHSGSFGRTKEVCFVYSSNESLDDPNSGSFDFFETKDVSAG